MKRIISFLFLIIMGISAMAQNISVKSFQALPMDMTASSLEGKRIDQNGVAAALIKIVTSQTGFAFDGGTLGIVDSKQMVGEIWVWVPYGSRKITISHQQLGVLREYRYPVEIQSERTYEMVLVTGTVETIVKEEVREQYLMFQVTPPEAVLEVNDQIWELDGDGTAIRFVNFGSYTYRVQAANYYSEAGKVEVNDPHETKIVPVTLKPNFGYVEVKADGNLRGSSVYIDNTFVGKAPCKSGPLKSGTHSIRIAKEMYDAYSETVTVSDGETLQLSPTLRGNFAEVTLTVDADAEIWVNNERKGTRSWTGPLASGTYKIECKLAGHETSLTTKEITPEMGGQSFTLPSPKPIYGSLNVESTPNMVTIFIDGKEIGKSPKFIPDILIGQHELKLTKEGYADYKETITINKGERKQTKATLNKLQEASQSVAQIPQDNIVEEEIFKIVEEMPSFPGGEFKLMEYISKNLKYPQIARETGIQGRVFVGFVVESDGSVSNVKILRGIGGGCDEEAMRIIKNMPKWKPGKQRGKAVRVSYMQPVNFKL